jgi:hypothetical protein
VWTEPSVPTNAHYSGAPDTFVPGVAEWTGFGVEDIIQAGTVAFAEASVWYGFWTEDFPDSPVFEGPSVNPGDDMYVDIQYQGSESTCYFLEDETTGDYQYFTNSSPYVELDSVPYIQERTEGKTYNGDPGFYLPDFGAYGVAGNSFGTSSQTCDLTSGDNLAYVMSSDCTADGVGLSVPSTVASNHSFGQYWYASTPYSNTC